MKFFVAVFVAVLALSCVEMLAAEEVARVVEVPPPPPPMVMVMPVSTMKPVGMVMAATGKPAPTPTPTPMMTTMMEKGTAKGTVTGTSSTPTTATMPAAMTTGPSKDKCEQECTKLEYEPICATNGRCLHEFPTLCVLDVLKCRNPRLDFKVVDMMRCRQPMLPRCTDKDFREDN